MLWRLVPGLLADFAQEGRVRVPSERRFDGAVLWADIVGFTALAEGLAAQGARGAERVAEVVNPYFDRLVTACEERGGLVHRFAGDAVVAVFRGEGATALALAAGRAVAAAVEPVPEAGRELRMRVGVAAGTIWAGVVGDAQRAEILVAGGPVAAAARAASLARPSELVTQRELASGASLEDARFAQAGNVAEPPRPPRLARPELDLLPFVPEGVDASELASAGLVGQGTAAWGAELRRAHVLFLHLPDLRFDEGGALDRAQRADRIVREILSRLDGRIVQFLGEEKGLTLVAAWGLRGNAHEDGASRALRAGLELRERLGAEGYAPRVGVSTGTILVGLRGGRDRFEPGIFGRNVNLAARLMQRAGTEAESPLLSDAATVEAAKNAAFDAREPIKVKGFEAPVDVRAVRGFQAGTLRGMRTPVLGREAERAQIAGLVASAKTRLETLILEGEAGAGKSLLLSETIARAEAEGFVVLVGAGEASETATPYYAFRAIFRALFDDVPEDAAPSVLEDAVRARLPDAHTAARLPLLAPVLPIDGTDNEVTAQLSGQPRAEATWRLMELLLEGAGDGRLIVLDDLHWIDSASRALATRLASRLTHGLLVLSTRPDSAAEPELAALVQKHRAHRLTLPPLEPAQIDALVARVLGAAEVQGKLGAAIFARSHGNPFFATQIALGLREAGRVQLEGDRAVLVGSAELEGQGSIGAVLVARIDRVPPASQEVLKAASVVGLHVASEELRAAWPELDAARIAPLVDAGLLVEERSKDLSFAHPLMREAAYGLLTFGQRRELHARVAGHLEKAVDDRRAALLAHHWEHAEELERAVPHLERAGRLAARAFASQEVVAFYGRAQKAAERAGLSVEKLRAARWERAIGEAKLKLLDYDGSEQHLAAALRLLGQSAPRTPGQRALSLASELGRQTWQRFFPRKAPAADAEACLEAADIVELENEIHWFRNDALGLTLGAFKQLNLAERAFHDSPQLVLAYNGVAVPTAMVGLHKLAADYAARGVRTVDDVPVLSARAYALLVQAVYHQAFGRWDEVERYGGRSRDLFAELGDVHRHQQTLALETVLHLHRGALKQARAVAEQLERTVGPDDPPQFLAWTVPTRAIADLVFGTLTERTLAQLTALADKKLEGGEKLLVLGVLAEVAGAAGAPSRAALRERALTHAETLLPSTYYGLRGYGGLAFAWISELERTGDRSAKEGAARALKQLTAFARAFPVGQPAKEILTARYERALGKDRTDALKQGLAAAEAAHLPYEAALAAGALGDEAALDRAIERLEGSLSFRRYVQRG